MLQEAAHKLHDLQVDGAPAVGFIFAVFEKDFSVFDFDDATVGDGDFKDIGRQIFDAVLAGRCGLTVNDPVLIPDIGGDLVIKLADFHHVAEFGFEDFRHGLDGQKKIDARAVPLSVRFGKRPAGHDIMDVRVIGHLPPPGVQHAEESGHLSADVFWIGGQLFNGL